MHSDVLFNELTHYFSDFFWETAFFYNFFLNKIVFQSFAK